MSRDQTRRRHGRHRSFDRLRRGDDSLGFLDEQQVRLDTSEAEEGIHDAMHLEQGEDESFTHEEVLQTSDPTDLGLTPAVIPPVYQGSGSVQSVIMLIANPVESYAAAAPSTTGLGDVWTIETWMYLTNPLGGNQSPFNLLPAAGNINDLSIGTGGGGDPISILTRDSAASNLYIATYAGWALGAWTMLTVTRSGSGAGSTDVYIDGVLAVPTLVSTDNAGTMTDTARTIRTPVPVHEWDGFMWCTTMWSSALTAPEVAYRFDEQNGKSASGWLDPTVDHGDYASAASNEHWYPFGFSNGLDLGNGSAVNLVPANIIFGATTP